MFAALVGASCLTSIWKVNLPIPLASGSTLSVSYAADLMALLLLGPAMRCSWRSRAHGRSARSTSSDRIRCTARRSAWRPKRSRWPSPARRTPRWGAASRRSASRRVARPLVGAIAAYFVVNTGLVATRHRAVHATVPGEDLARGLSLERRQLHRRRQRRRAAPRSSSRAASTGWRS